MSQGNTKCKLFGNCPNFTTADKCTTGCHFYVSKNPDEMVEISDKVDTEIKGDLIKLLASDLPKFDKKHEFFVMKRHVFILQSVSPKKIVLKYKRKLSNTDGLTDGCYIFRDQKDKLLEPTKVFKIFDRKIAAEKAAKDAAAEWVAAKAAEKK